MQGELVPRGPSFLRLPVLGLNPKPSGAAGVPGGLWSRGRELRANMNFILFYCVSPLEGVRASSSEEGGPEDSADVEKHAHGSQGTLSEMMKSRS